MKGVNKKARLIIIVLILIECFSIFLTYKSFENKRINEYINKHELTKDTFAIFTEDDYGNYKEQVDSSMGWPNPSDFSLNPVKSYCVDNNENKVTGILSYDSSNQSAIVKTNKTVFCYLYFNRVSKGLEIEIKDGFPADYHINKNISCNGTASAGWDYLHNNLKVDSVSSKNAKCELTFNNFEGSYTLYNKVMQMYYHTNSNGGYCTNTSYTDKSSCESAGGSWWGVFRQQVAVVNSSPEWTTMKYNRIETIETSPSNSFQCIGDICTGTGIGGLTGGTHRFALDNVDGNGVGKITFKFKDAGYYQVCYNIPKTKEVFLPNPNKIKIAGVYEHSVTETNALVGSEQGCFDIGYVEKNDQMTISGVLPDDYTVRDLYFYLQRTSNYYKYDTGYRFAGEDPNNYIWFNNELWRIIGYVSMPGKSGSAFKIIKEDDMENFFYTTGANSPYNNSSLSCFLNRNYLNKTNGNLDNYCSNRGTIARWDFSINGIDEYYRSLIEPVKWSNINTIENYSNYATNYKDNKYLSNGYPTRFYYRKEVENLSSSTSFIGLKNQSDVQLASLPNSNIEENVQYNNRLNWLQNNSLTDIKLNGATNSTMVNYKPVVYLKQTTNVISGTGTKADPFIIL